MHVEAYEDEVGDQQLVAYLHMEYFLDKGWRLVSTHGSTLMHAVNALAISLHNIRCEIGADTLPDGSMQIITANTYFEAILSPQFQEHGDEWEADMSEGFHDPNPEFNNLALLLALIGWTFDKRHYRLCIMIGTDDGVPMTSHKMDVHASGPGDENQFVEWIDVWIYMSVDQEKWMGPNGDAVQQYAGFFPVTYDDAQVCCLVFSNPLTIRNYHSIADVSAPDSRSAGAEV